MAGRTTELVARPRVPLHHTTASRALSPKMTDLWSAYNVALVTQPLLTKSITAGVIIGAGDAAAQQIERKRTGENFDLVRYLRWAIFGLILQGPWNHAFYLLLDSALPPTPEPFTLVTLMKVGIDQFIQACAPQYSRNLLAVLRELISHPCGQAYLHNHHLVFFRYCRGEGPRVCQEAGDCCPCGVDIRNCCLFVVHAGS